MDLLFQRHVRRSRLYARGFLLPEIPLRQLKVLKNVLSKPLLPCGHFGPVFLAGRRVFEAHHRELDVEEERLLWGVEGHNCKLEQNTNMVYGIKW